MIIRRLVETDLEEFFQCRLRALKSAPTAFLSSYEDTVAKGPEAYLNSLQSGQSERALFGALLDEKVVGTIGIYKETSARLAHKANIWGVFVDPIHRGSGIAEMLLNAAVEFARQHMEVQLINLSVESSNSVARRLYGRKGFKLWGTEPMSMKYMGTYLDEDHMVLRL